MSEVSYNSPLPGFSFKYSSCPRASNPLPILHLLSFIHHDSNTDVLRVVYMFNRNVILFREYSGNCGAASQSVVNNALQYHARRAALVQCISSTTACYVRRASGVNSGYTPIGNTLIAIRTPRRCNTLDGPRGGKRGGGGAGSPGVGTKGNVRGNVWNHWSIRFVLHKQVSRQGGDCHVGLRSSRSFRSSPPSHTYTL